MCATKKKGDYFIAQNSADRIWQYWPDEKKSECLTPACWSGEPPVHLTQTSSPHSPHSKVLYKH